MILYHYTTRDGYLGIHNTGRVIPSGFKSNPWTPKDASYGPGWYFTDLGPENCDACIALQCWADPNQTHKVEYYLEFQVHESLPRRCRAFVFMIGNWIAGLVSHSGGGKKSPRRCSLHWH